MWYTGAAAAGDLPGVHPGAADGEPEEGAAQGDAGGAEATVRGAGLFPPPLLFLTASQGLLSCFCVCWAILSVYMLHQTGIGATCMFDLFACIFAVFAQTEISVFNSKLSMVHPILFCSEETDAPLFCS